jgi:hypothetical protein
MRTNFGWTNLKGCKPSGRYTVGVDGRIILKRILNKYGEKVWIHLAQERDQWRALVNTVMNIKDR